MENSTNAKSWELTDQKNGKYSIKITIPKDIFTKSYQEVLKQAAAGAEIKGFRKGKVPVSVIEDSSKGEVLIKTFEKLAPSYAYLAIGTEKLEPIAPLTYTQMPQLDTDKDIEFTLTVVTMPAFKKLDVKKIKVTMDNKKVTKKDVETIVENMQKNNSDTKEKEMGDRWAAEIAGRYNLKGVKDLAKLKEEIEKVLQNEKGKVIEEKFGKDVIREGVKICDINIPQEAIDYEAQQREHSFEHELSHYKITVQDYLSKQNLKIEDLRKAWNSDAKEALEEHALLTDFAKTRNIQVDEKEFADFLQQVKGDRDIYDNKAWVDSLRSLYLKNKAFAALVSEVKANLGINEEKPKKEIELVS